MPQELCPRCRTTVNVTVKTSVATKTVDGVRKRVVVEDYWCERCGAFIKNEEREET